MTSPHHDDVSRSEIEALGATRADLGREYEPALLDNFADRVERAIDARVASEVARRDPHGRPVRGAGQQLALGIISLVSFIPIAIVLGINGAWFALLVTLASIVAVNYAHVALHKGPDRR